MMMKGPCCGLRVHDGRWYPQGGGVVYTGILTRMSEVGNYAILVTIPW